MKKANIAFTLSLLLLVVTSLPAQGDDLSQLKDEVRELSEKLEIMEATAGGDEEHQSSLVDLSGYYDFTYVDNSLSSGSAHDGTFRQHHLSLFVGKKIEKFKFFAEVEWEYGPKVDLEGGIIDGGTDKAELLVETAWLEYNYTNWFNIRTGKHLVPHGWWNLNHYPILVLTTSRPLASDKIFPDFSTGINFYGSLFASGIQADYVLYYINDLDNDSTNKTDADSNKGVGGRFALHLPILDAFDIGFSALGGRTNNTTSDEYWGLDELIKVGPLEVQSELVYNKQQYLDDGSRVSRRGYYIQPSLSHFLPNDLGRIALVYRYDYLDKSTNVANDQVVTTIGLNYQPISNVAIKSEYSWNNPVSTKNYNDVQLSITIFF